MMNKSKLEYPNLISCIYAFPFQYRDYVIKQIDDLYINQFFDILEIKDLNNGSNERYLVMHVCIKKKISIFERISVFVYLQPRFPEYYPIIKPSFENNKYQRNDKALYLLTQTNCIFDSFFQNWRCNYTLCDSLNHCVDLFTQEPPFLTNSTPSLGSFGNSSSIKELPNPILPYNPGLNGNLNKPNIYNNNNNNNNMNNLNNNNLNNNNRNNLNNNNNMNNNNLNNNNLNNNLNNNNNNMNNNNNNNLNNNLPVGIPIVVPDGRPVQPVIRGIIPSNPIIPGPSNIIRINKPIVPPPQPKNGFAYGPSPMKANNIESVAESYCEINTSTYHEPVKDGAISIKETQMFEGIMKNSEYDLSTVLTISYSDLVNKTMIGEGTFATVWQAKWDNQIVAIKEPKKIPSPQEQINLNREIYSMAMTNNDYFIQLRGVTKTPNNLPCIVMEKADMTLTKLLETRTEPIPPWVRLIWCLQIASGIHFLHERNFIHRDLKCDNILLVKGNCKIGDLGLARTQSINMTVTGTPVAMAPELLRSDEGLYTKKVDVYAYALIVYMIFVRENPFCTFRSMTELKQFILSGRRPRIPEFVPLSISSLISMCWAQNENDRPDMKTVLILLSRLRDESRNWNLNDNVYRH